MRTKVKTVKSFDESQPRKLVVEWNDGVSTTFDMDHLTPDIVQRLAWHGLSQKTMDAHSGTMSSGGTVADARAVSQEVFDNLVDGTWSTAREAGTSWVVEALAELYETTVEDAQEKYDGLDEKARKGLTKHPKLVAWKAERDLARARARAEDDDSESVIDKLFG